jgi:type I restriction enzyme S subunit
MTAHTEFKETEFAPLPADWALHSIAESCYKPEYGYTATAIQAAIGPKFLRITDIQEHRVDWQTVPYCRYEKDGGKYQLRPGDILFARIGATTGKTFLVRDCPDAIYASYLIRVRAHAVDPAFLYYFCNSEMYWHQINAHKSDKLKGGISGSLLAQIRHCSPPLDEQRAMAAVLSKILVAVELQDKIVATLKELKASTMAKLFREGLRGEPLKQTEIGEIPEDWKVNQLGKVAQIGNGSTPKRDNSSYWEDGHIPWLTSAKVHESVIESADEFVTDIAREKCHLPLVRKGSVVVAITGQGKTLGNAALVTFDTCVSQHLAYIQLQTDEVLPEFMLFFLQGRYGHFRQVSHAGGSTKGALTCGFLKNYSVPIPPFEEQKQIARVIGSLVTKLKIEESRRQALKHLFSSMLHLLMTGQVRVTPEMIALQTAGRAARRPKWSGKIDEKVLEQVVKRIVEAVAPEKIIVFGSAARGEMGPDSDLDLLIVKSGVHRLATAQMIEHSLIGITIPTDIVVATPKDIEAHKNTIGLIYRPALQEGKILYAA